MERLLVLTKSFAVCMVVFVLTSSLVECRYQRRSDNKRYNMGWSNNNNNNNNDNYYNGNDGGSGYSNNDDNRQELEAFHGVKKAFGLSKIVLSPIVLPMIFFVGIVLLLFFAVIGSSAVVGNALGRRVPYRRHAMFAKQLSTGTAKLARSVLTSHQCIERISCELSKNSRSLDTPNWIKSTLESVAGTDNWIVGRIFSGVNSSDCLTYHCPLASSIALLRNKML